jgi:hypothetical protein
VGGVEGIGYDAPKVTCASLTILIPNIRYGYFFVFLHQDA